MGKESTFSKETQEIWIQLLGREDVLEEEMATQSSIITWKNPMYRGTVIYSQRVAKGWTELSE